MTGEGMTRGDSYTEWGAHFGMVGGQGTDGLG